MTEQTEKPLIYAKMVAIMQDIKPISKDQTNEQQGFKFRGIDDVYIAVHDIMAKHEVFTTTEILNEEHKEVLSSNNKTGIHSIIRYKFTFHAIDGSSITTDAVGEAVDYGDKSCGKCHSYADKFAILTTFKIPIGDMPDPDKDSHDLKAKKSEPKKTKKKVEEKPTCPKCGKTDSVIKNKAEYGGGFACWEKAKSPGCGHKWQNESNNKKEENKTETKKNDDSDIQDPEILLLADELLKRITTCKSIWHLKNWWEKHKESINKCKKEYPDKFVDLEHTKKLLKDKFNKEEKAKLDKEMPTKSDSPF